jgi:hypothetical protein
VGPLVPVGGVLPFPRIHLPQVHRLLAKPLAIVRRASASIGKIISLAVDFALRVGNNAVMDFFAHSGALPEQKLKSQ